MRRLGYCTKEEFLGAAKPRKGYPAYSMLDTGSGQVELFEEITYWFRASNGVFRTTYRNRFEKLDALVLSWLQKLFSPAAELRVEDRAASHCLTSAEWAGRLLPHFPHLRFGASDLLLFLLEAKPASGGGTFILEPDGTPLQYIEPPYVIPLADKDPWVYVVNRWMRYQATKRIQAAPPPAALLEQAQKTPVTGGGWTVRRIPYVHPEAQALERSTGGAFRTSVQSVFDASAEPCHAVRAMNILNLSYFSQARLLEGVRAGWLSLEEGGLWIVGRSLEEDFTTHATIFQKKGDRFEKLERLGKGSEIEELVLGFSA